MVVKNIHTEEEEKDVRLCRVERSVIGEESDLNIYFIGLYYCTVCTVNNLNVDTGVAE